MLSRLTFLCNGESQPSIKNNLYNFKTEKTMAQEDDLRALGKIMDFLRAVSIILAIMNVYWYCYEAMHMWGVTIGVVDRILINFNRTGGKYFISQ